MIRTQIYLPDETHAHLKQLARQENTTLSKLIREAASEVIKKKYGKKSPQEKMFKFLADPPRKYRLSVSGKTAIQLIRQDRDGGY